MRFNGSNSRLRRKFRRLCPSWRKSSCVENGKALGPSHPYFFPPSHERLGVPEHARPASRFDCSSIGAHPRTSQAYTRDAYAYCVPAPTGLADKHRRQTPTTISGRCSRHAAVAAISEGSMARLVGVRANSPGDRQTNAAGGSGDDGVLLLEQLRPAFTKVQISSCAFAKRRQCIGLGNRGVEQSGSSSGS